MKKLEIHMRTDDNRKPDDIHFDDMDGTGIRSYLLLTQISDGSHGHFLAYGSSDDIGKMLFSFWRNTLLMSDGEGDQMALVLEKVAEDIIGDVNMLRGEVKDPYGFGGGVVGNA